MLSNNHFPSSQMFVQTLFFSSSNSINTYIYYFKIKKTQDISNKRVSNAI